MRLGGKSIWAGDAHTVRQLLERADVEGVLRRDEFGLHPVPLDLDTALTLAQEIGLSRAAILAAALWHTCASHAPLIEEVRLRLGDDVADIVQGLLRTQSLESRYGDETTHGKDAENFRSLVVAMAEDIRVIFVVIAARVCLMRRLRDTPNTNARRRVADEASTLYAPLAHKLGLYKLKSELEDLSLKYLETEAYYHIKDMLGEKKRSRDAYVAQFLEPVERRLTAAGLTFHTKGRTKSIHSIWQKMKKQGVDVDGVYDLLAIRIILDSPPEREKQDCWQAFSIVTDMYQSNPKRMRDWLSVPKSNGYESLHTTVLGPGGKWVEVQIRTERMDDIAERGLAAHWRYKGVASQVGGIEDWLGSARAALEQGDDERMLAEMRRNMESDEVFVFTPKGDLHRLTAGATVLDFAYAIHTSVGNHCTGAKIGGKMATIRTRLRSGDQVEILTSNSQKPKQDWLDIARTGRARSKIRQSLKAMEAGQARLAREELERRLKNHKVEVREATMMRTIDRMGYKVVTDFFKDLADGSLDQSRVMEAYVAQLRHEKGEAPAQILHTPQPGAAQASGQQEAKTAHRTAGDPEKKGERKDMRGLAYSLARCCYPQPGDEVFGFVTRMGGIKIHRTDCPNAPELRERFAYRVLRAQWAKCGDRPTDITLSLPSSDDPLLRQDDPS